MARNIKELAEKMGAEIVGQVPAYSEASRPPIPILTDHRSGARRPAPVGPSILWRCSVLSRFPSGA